MAKKLPLTQGKYALVDDEDFERVNQYKWAYDNSTGYARSNRPIKPTYLHRFIQNAPKGTYVDHINGDKFDNRKTNLRLSTNQQNCSNQVVRKNNTSGYKGVGWHKQMNKWRAYIEVNWKHMSLGLYDNKKDAARAYNLAAKKYFGEFAKLNEL